MSTLAAVFALLIFLTSLFGSTLPLYIHRRWEHLLQWGISFGAGLLLGLAFVHMIPEASHLLPDSYGLWVLVGFLILLVLERFVMVHACDEHGCHYHTVGVAALLGLATHGVIEGLALATSLVVPELGWLVLAAILAHKGPAGLALTSILQMAKKTPKQIVLFSTAVALSGPVGIWLGYSILRQGLPSYVTGTLLAVSSGTFVYIACCDLLPEVHKSGLNRVYQLLGLGLGVALSLLGTLVLNGHTH